MPGVDSPRSAAGAPQPRHMTPCACHCAACHATGHGGLCAVLRASLHNSLDGNLDMVDCIEQQYYRSCRSCAVSFDSPNWCVRYGPGGLIAAGGRDGPIHLICAQTGEKIRCHPTGHSEWFNCISWAPDGKRLASGSQDETVKIWNPATGECLSTLSCDAPVRSVSFSPDSKIIAAGCYEKVELIDAVTYEVKSSLSGHSGQVESLSWSNDGTKLASGSNDNMVKIWDLADPATGECLWTLVGHTADNEECTCQHILVEDSDEHEVPFIERNPDCPVTGHWDVVSSVRFSPDGKQLASGSHDATVRVWDPASGECLATLNVESTIFDIAWNNDGTKLVSCGRDGIVKFWSVGAAGTFKDHLTLSFESQNMGESHGYLIQSVEFSPSGTTIIAAFNDYLLDKFSVQILTSETPLKNLARGRGSGRAYPENLA